MSEAEHPLRRTPGREVTVEDVRQLMGASTPHFALQLRNRIARLTRLGYSGENRGLEAEEGLPPLASLGRDAATTGARDAHA